MTSICPTITADNQDQYLKQIEGTLEYAVRLHIDIADGEFTKNKLMDIENVWWPGGVRADLHVMFQKPFIHTAALLALQPQLVIVHAEAEGDFIEFSNTMHRHGIEVGIALLPATSSKAIEPALDYIDHVLIFSGSLGHFGGHADLRLLEKAKRLRSLKPSLELGWDGGINDQNARQLVHGGIDVLNVGGYLNGSQSPAAAYATLKALVES